MPLAPGTRLGPYEILAPLGAGGMGEVYRARDTRLSRDVAIKVLPDHLTSNPEIRARFEREAKTVSSLNHPNICTLFDVGKEGGADFLVLELVEGETLAQRLTRGPLPLAEALRVGGQIADALDRAHRAGVVHRDLKPGNIMLTKAGAKLMDFGLARATGLAGPGDGATVVAAHSPTIAAPLTAEGTLVGTFQYMAPEQLEGGEADARSDIWAFGCVLYEMVSGRRAFEGKSQASLISAIMGQAPPPLSQVAPVAPPALERVIATSLEKDPDERWQSAGDLRRELQWISGASPGAAGTGSSAAHSGAVAAAATEAAGRARARARLVANGGWIAAFVLALVALALAVTPALRRPPVPPLMRFTLEAPPGLTLQEPAEAAFSPDGRAIVFEAADSGGTVRLYVRRLDSADARLVPGTERAGLPFWSPDGKALAFFADGKLRRVALDGSAPVVLCDAPDPRGGAWSASDVIVFAPNNSGGIWRVPANGGDPVQVTHVAVTRHEVGHRYPQFLPGDKRFLYVAIGQGEDMITYAASLDGGAPVEVLRGGTKGVYAAPGYLLYLDATQATSEHRLLARRFDAGSLRTSGDPVLLSEHVDANNFGYPNLAATADGNLLVERSSPRHAAFDWWDAGGHRVSGAIDDLDGSGPEVSPDHRRAAYTCFDPLDVFVRDLATGTATRLTFEKRGVNFIVWSPDSRSIVFARLTVGQGWGIYRKAADGSGPDSLILRGPGLFAYPLSWSSDGRWLLAQCSDSTGGYDLWKIPMDGQGQAAPYQRTPGQEQYGYFSPDGKWVCYVESEGEHSYAYVQGFPDPGPKYQVEAPDPAYIQWLEPGDALLVASRSNTVYRIPVSTAGGFHAGSATRLFTIPGSMFVTDSYRDGSRFLVGHALPVEQPARFEVILGWPELLSRK